jgi:hypothetical protein
MIASQLVLISVPAYLDAIELEVMRGFYDRDASEGGEASDLSGLRVGSFEKSSIRIKVPPDYTALDGIVIGNRLVNGPKLGSLKITDAGGCYSTEPDGIFTLAIPGNRLWRSTVVTLDGLTANRIEVMPDMRGIVATFNEPSGPDAVIRPELLPGPHSLVVWTSEGHDKANIEICPDNPAIVAGK